ncbi:MAG TPA: SRPBCC domain-containing protein [Nocardioidaceae bacterium]|nr:SRPBCC domain-containing protein [Nocardioidaceae bacterium]
MSFTQTTELPVSPEEAFALITEPERLRRWKTVSAYVDLRAGGEYRFTIVPGQTAAGKYREIEPGRRIVFGWGWEGSPDLPPDTSTVTVTIEPTDAGSRVTLVHEGLTPEQEESHGMGWHHFFERLETLIVKGDAGQDEWAWAPEQLDPSNAADAALSAIQPVLRALTREDQPKPTPCNDFTAHQLVVHLIESLVGIGGMAGTTIPAPDGPSAEDKVSVAAAAAIDAWRGQDEWQARLLPVELLLHGWDLAQATGQTVRVSDEVVGYVRGLAEAFVPGGRERGSFGPEVTASGDASPIDSLAAYAGRTALI